MSTVAVASTSSETTFALVQPQRRPERADNLSSAPQPAAAARLIRQAMQRQDELVISLKYRDKKGDLTRRIISPIRFVAPNRFLALCLCRCEPRQFQLDRCSEVQLKRAEDYVMPVELA